MTYKIPDIRTNIWPNTGFFTNCPVNKPDILTNDLSINRISGGPDTKFDIRPNTGYPGEHYLNIAKYPGAYRRMAGRPLSRGVLVAIFVYWQIGN